MKINIITIYPFIFLMLFSGVICTVSLAGSMAPGGGPSGEIQGKTRVSPRIEYSYFIEGSPIANRSYFWIVFGGTITNEDGFEVDIEWNSAGTGSVELWERVFIPGQPSSPRRIRSLSVQIVPLVSFTYDATGNRTNRSIDLGTKGSGENYRESFNDNLDNVHYHIFPNPTQGELTIQISNWSDESSITYSVRDLNGKMVVPVTNAGATTVVDLSVHPSGVYILTVMANGKRHQWKIIKE